MKGFYRENYSIIDTMLAYKIVIQLGFSWNSIAYSNLRKIIRFDNNTLLDIYWGARPYCEVLKDTPTGLECIKLYDGLSDCLEFLSSDEFKKKWNW